MQGAFQGGGSVIKKRVKIKAADLVIDSHGLLVLDIGFDFAGISTAYIIDGWEDVFEDRVSPWWSLPLLRRIMEMVDVISWSDVIGKQVFLEWDRPVGEVFRFGNGDRWVDFKSNPPVLDNATRRMSDRFDGVAYKVAHGNCPFIEEKVTCIRTCKCCPGEQLCECGEKRFFHNGAAWLGTCMDKKNCTGFKPKRAIPEVFR
jgi:hypothetical protein